MRKWAITATVRGGKYLGTVEAATQEEAIKKGWELDTCWVGFCHACAEHCEDPEIDALSADEETSS